MFTLDKIEKMKKVFLVCLIAISTIFMSGFNNAYAYDSNSTSDKGKADAFAEAITQANFNDILNSSCFIRTRIKRSTSDFYPKYYDYYAYLVFPSTSYLDKQGAYFNKDTSSNNAFSLGVEFKEPEKNRPYFFMVLSGSYTRQGKSYSYFYVEPFNTNVHYTYTSENNSAYANFDVKDRNGNLLFHQPLVKEAEKLIPGVKADTTVIVTIVGVFLVGLVICLTLLRKVSRIY